MGIIYNSIKMLLITPVRYLVALRWNKPLVNIPIGQTVQNTLNRKTAELATAKAKTPPAVAPLLLETTLIIGQDLHKAALLSSRGYSMLAIDSLALLASSLGRKSSTPLSKLSITVPTGQIQPQKKFPKRRITSKTSRTAKIVGIRRRISTFPVTKD
jgi:hypothetical protein